MFILFLYASRRLSSTATIDLGIRIKQLNHNKQFQKAIALFDSHVQELQSKPVAIHQALRACIELGDFKRGKDIHRRLSSYLANDTFICTSLIRLYMKSGDLLAAQTIFDRSSNKSIAMYASMLNGLVDNNRAEEALNLFRQMNLEPNEYIFSAIFKICAQLADDRSLKFGKHLLNTMPVKFKSNSIVLTSALYMFVQCHDIQSGEELFSQIEKNIITYGSMMTGFVSNNMPHKAIDLFFQISKPNEFIFSIVFKACAQLGNIKGVTLGKKILSQLPVEYRQSNRVLQSALNMLTKCDDQQSAETLFAQLNRNVICYGSMMKMYNLLEQPEMTLTLFERMKQEKIQPDEIIFTLLIDACSHLGDVGLCQSTISQLPAKSLIDPWIQNGLIDMWGKVGLANEAKCVFDAIDRPNNISFTAMINAFGLNGMGREAIQLFRQVPVHMIDQWMYVCVLNACSHSGLSKEAGEIFDKIPVKDKTERIYTTMVDNFSRVSLFDKAQQLLTEYEQCHPPSMPMHMAILSGARNKIDTLISQKVFDRMQLLFPRDKMSQTVAPVLLANTYASWGDFSTAANIRMKMNQSIVKKKAGCSWTVVNGEVARFRAHDRSHPRSKEIYDELDRLMEEMIEQGYKCDPSWITRPLMNDETTESVLSGHSERLAIAFNLIQRPIPTRIQIVKNLRVCGDCHVATKLIARIRQCLIVVRDAHRVHHFYPDGQCSCGDHF